MTKDMTKDKKVAVMMGGTSPERDISLRSGAACSHALRRCGYRVVDIVLDGPQPHHGVGNIMTTDAIAKLTAQAPDVVFNALHGVGGEDGVMQGVLESMGIDYTHSGVLASALAMHKDKAKDIWRAQGLPVARSIVTSGARAVADLINFGTPCVVKPVTGGSSLGVFIIDGTDNVAHEEKLNQALAISPAIMIEQYIEGCELSCALMETAAGEVTVLGVVEIKTPRGFYDTNNKYDNDHCQHIIPPNLAPPILEKVHQVSRDAYKALGCRGLARVDFRFNPAHKDGLVILELNTQPGMTEKSLVPELAIAHGLSYEQLVQWIVEDASCQR